MRLKYKPFRLAVQLSSLIALNAMVISWVVPGFKIGRLPIPLPVLVSINSPTSVAFSALDVIQYSLSLAVFPTIALASILIIGALIGRALCGWVCPIGFVQDIITDLKGLLTTVSPRTHRWAMRVKYFVLALTLLISGTLGISLYLGVGEDYKEALGPLAAGPFTAISPDGTLFGTIPRIASSLLDAYLGPFSAEEASRAFWGLIGPAPSLTILKLLVLLGFFYGAYRIPRLWCRYLCPVGALMAIFQSYSFIGMSRDPLKCSKCPHCEPACPMQIPILDLPWEKFNHPECILCMECVDACPNGSLRPKFP